MSAFSFLVIVYFQLTGGEPVGRNP